jgi:hypothetical protein
MIIFEGSDIFKDQKLFHFKEEFRNKVKLFE